MAWVLGVVPSINNVGPAGFFLRGYQKTTTRQRYLHYLLLIGHHLTGKNTSRWLPRQLSGLWALSCSEMATKLWWDNMTAFGIPVVPLDSTTAAQTFLASLPSRT